MPNLTPRKILDTFHRRVWQPLSPRKRMGVKVVLVIGLLGIGVRSLPYLAPVRAKELVQTDRAIEFSDRNGLPLGTLLSRSQDHTAVVPLDKISDHFIHAIIAAEDGRFYDHGPVDWVAMGRAVLEAIEARQIMSGASTLTMQLARLIDPTPRTVIGKVQEIWLAWRLGAGMTHDEILHAYINRLPMGGNLYGVEAAAQAYFGSSAQQLNLAQASLLAAIPNDPNQLNPYDHWSALKRRQRYVLEQMAEDGYIALEQVDRVMAEKITLSPRPQGIIAAPHFLFWLADQLPDDHPAQLRTTLDRNLQNYVQAQVKSVVRDLAPHQVTQAAALVVDNQTGDVLAYVGSTDYLDPQHQGRNDGVQALRQPGSTLKPFLYELALEQGLLQPNSILADVPTAYAIPGGQLYQPLDYHEKFLGPVRVRVALANSLNVPAVRLLEKVTVTDFLDRLHQLQFSHLQQEPEFYGLGLALGGGEVTLWELTQAYVMMANQGQFTSLRGLINAPPALESPNSLDPSQAPNWSFMTDILSDRIARAQAFGVDSVLSLPFPAAVKTGTSSDYRDTWTIGFTRDYTVATWVGNFDGSPMKNVSGVMGAAPLWNRILLHLHATQEPDAFEPPQGWIKTPICAISGHKPTNACPTIVQEYLRPQDLASYQQDPDPFFELANANHSAQAPQYQLNLPSEYNHWVAKHPDLPGAHQLKVISPQSGDTFVLSSSATGESAAPRQTLEFKASAQHEKPLQWWINDRRLPQDSRQVFWPLEPGDWTLTVSDGTQRDRIQFSVLQAEAQPSRRGFSIQGEEK